MAPDKLPRPTGYPTFDKFLLYQWNIVQIPIFVRLSANFSAGEICEVWADIAQIHPQPAAEGEEDPPGDLLNKNNNFWKKF